MQNWFMQFGNKIGVLSVASYSERNTYYAPT
uniref:Uncharacterized protein n=1 Tax=Arundo donax TaxID=35708 RepID=A0A0A9BL58_ARUDO